VAPWLVRNYVAFGVLGISPITGTNLLNINYSYLLEDMGVPNVQEVLAPKESELVAAVPRARKSDGPRGLLSTFARRELLTHWKQYTVTTFKRHPRLYAGTGAIATLRLFGDAEGVAALEKAIADRRAWRKVPLRALVLRIGYWLFLVFAYTSAVVGMNAAGMAKGLEHRWCNSPRDLVLRRPDRSSVVHSLSRRDASRSLLLPPRSG
jgi:hypothetical protein